MYVFDSSPLTHLFRNFYLHRFSTLWAKFDEMVQTSEITSVNEVYKEVSNNTGIEDRLSYWAEENKDYFFTLPSAEEMMFIHEIFRIKNFRDLVPPKNLYSGNPVVDPFVIAKAQINNACVVTFDGFSIGGQIKEHAPKIANICRYFSIYCCNLEQFMERENWSF